MPDPSIHPKPNVTLRKGTRGEPLHHQLVACQRCRKQKLRCSKEKPSCRRCQHISAVCTYPPAPDRKLLAAQRAQSTKTRVPTSRKSIRPDPSQESTFERLPEGALMPQDVAVFLIERYLSHQWNASLLFYKPTLISDFLDNKVPDFVISSIFARASNFLFGSPKRPSLESNASPRLSQLSIEYSRRYEQEWATAAGKGVLLSADDPSLENIRASVNLTYYWYTVGHRRRANFYMNTAYRICQTLGLHQHYTSSIESDPLLSEMKRRSFWACWVAFCAAQGKARFPTEWWKEAIGPPLPCDEASYLAGKPDLTEFFDENGDLVRINRAQGRTPSASIMGQMAKINSIWWQIHGFVEKYSNNCAHGFAERISGLLALDRRLETFFDNLDTCFHYVGLESFKSSTDPYILFELQCMYHLCVCLLHSSLVPIFSGIPSDPNVSMKFTKMSVKQVVKHSMIVLEMTAAFLSLDPDLSRLSAVTGYILFVVSVIQFKAIVAQGKQWSQGLSCCNGALLILQKLKEHILPLQSMWASLYSLFSSTKIDINNLSTDLELAASFLALDIDTQQIISQEAASPDRTASMNLGDAAAMMEQSSTSISSSTVADAGEQVLQMNDPGDGWNPAESASRRQEFVLPIEQPSLGPSRGLSHKYQFSEPQSQSYYGTASHYQQINVSHTLEQDLEASRVASSITYALPQAVTIPMDVVAGSMEYQMPMRVVGQLPQIDDMDLWWNEPFEESGIGPSQFGDEEFFWTDG